MPVTTVAEVLDAVIALIGEPEKWTKGGAFAKSVSGRPVDCLGPDAALWDTTGAIYKACGAINSPRGLHAFNLLDQRVKRRGFRHLADFNDDPATTHSDVIKLLREVRASLDAA